MTKVEFTHTPAGIVHTITSPHGLFPSTQIDYFGQLVLALDVFTASNDFDMEYVLFRQDHPTEHIKHSGEEFPTLLKDPKGCILLGLEKEVNGKRMMFTTKIFPPESNQRGLITKRFGDGFLGFIDNTGYYFSYRYLNHVDFEDGKITVHRNKIYKTNSKGILNHHYIHVLRQGTGTTLVHDQLDKDFRLIFSREFDAPRCDFFYILNLSMDSISRIMTFNEDSKDLYLWAIHPDNTIHSQVLISFDSPISTIFDGAPLCSGAILHRFTTEDQNGWLIIKEGKILEGFIEKELGYQSLFDETFIHLGKGDWIVSDASPTTGNGYCISFYPYNPSEDFVEKVLLLNRSHPDP